MEESCKVVRSLSFTRSASMPRPTRIIMLTAALSAVLLLQADICGAAYSCCSEERRGTVCTLAGNGGRDSADSPTASTAAFYTPVSVALYPPSSIVVAGINEHRLRIIHHNGSVSTLAGGGPIRRELRLSTSTATTLSLPGFRVRHIFCALKRKAAFNFVTTATIVFAPSSATGQCVPSLDLGQLATQTVHDPLQSTVLLSATGIASIVENGQRLIIIGGNYDHRIRVIYANGTVSTLAGSGGIGNMNCANQQGSADPLAAQLLPSGWRSYRPLRQHHCG